jgi:hypothetical protein
MATMEITITPMTENYNKLNNISYQFNSSHWYTSVCSIISASAGGRRHGIIGNWSECSAWQGLLSFTYIPNLCIASANKNEKSTRIAYKWLFLML